MIKRKFEKLSKKIKNKLTFAVLMFFVINVLVSCSVCDGPAKSGIGAAEPRIYFSSLSSNGAYPAIFEISREGKYLRQIIENAEIFSPPSDDKWIVFKRIDSGSGIVNLMKVSDQGGGFGIQQASAINFAEPVVSPTSGAVAYRKTNTRLVVQKFGGGSANSVTDLLIDSSDFKFSADGKYLAFFEQMNGSVNLKIIDGTKTDGTIFIFYNKDLTGFAKSGNAWSMNWCKTAPILIFTARKNDSDYVKILDMSTFADSTLFELDAGKLGASQPDMSPDRKFVSFVTNSGQVAVANADSEIPLISFITESTYEQNELPEWSPDGLSLIYKGFASYDKAGFGSLNIANLTIKGNLVEVKEKFVLSGNVTKGFWKQYKN